MDVRSTQVYGMVSAAVSGGDGVQHRTLQPQPPALGASAYPGPVSAPTFAWAEMLRRLVTYIMSPSATIVSGGSAGAIAIAFGANTLGGASGILGMFQGVPFVLSAAGTLSGSPTSAISTASTTIRKVLVTIGMSALPVASSLALGGGTVQFVYGSAYNTSAGAATSGGQGVSYFDFVPLPIPSAGEIPVGWLNIPNSFAVSAGINASHMFTDYRVTQGVNLSALLAGIPQP